MNDISVYILAALATLITLAVHEYAHGYAAFRLGDPTAKNLGRLTLNPLKHLDPVGAICMVLFHFGWAKPVPINPRYFKKPKRDFALTALAGPATNLLLAFLSVPLYLLLYRVFSGVDFPTELSFRMAYFTLLFIQLFHLLNRRLAIFNLIPIPPLDGSRILHAVLPERLYFKLMRYERTIYLCLIVWLLAGGVVSNALLRLPVLGDSPVIRVIAEILSLSGLLGRAIGALSSLMFRLWELIPFLSMY